MTISLCYYLYRSRTAYRRYVFESVTAVILTEVILDINGRTNSIITLLMKYVVSTGPSPFSMASTPTDLWKFRIDCDVCLHHLNHFYNWWLTPFSCHTVYAPLWGQSS